jgi:hypothetical protein
MRTENELANIIHSQVDSKVAFRCPGESCNSNYFGVIQKVGDKINFELLVLMVNKSE